MRSPWAGLRHSEQLAAATAACAYWVVATPLRSARPLPQRCLCWLKHGRCSARSLRSLPPLDRFPVPPAAHRRGCCARPEGGGAGRGCQRRCARPARPPALAGNQPHPAGHPVRPPPSHVCRMCAAGCRHCRRQLACAAVWRSKGCRQALQGGCGLMLSGVCCARDHPSLFNRRHVACCSLCSPAGGPRASLPRWAATSCRLAPQVNSKQALQQFTLSNRPAAQGANRPAAQGVGSAAAGRCPALLALHTPLHRSTARPPLGPSLPAAPLSQSKGPGIDIHPLMFTYPAGGNDVAVQIYDSDFAAAAGLAEYVAKVRFS